MYFLEFCEPFWQAIKCKKRVMGSQFIASWPEVQVTIWDLQLLSQVGALLSLAP